MIDRDGRTCVECGTRYVPSRLYRGEYCPACRTAARDAAE